MNYNSFEKLLLDSNNLGSNGAKHIAKIIENSQKLYYCSMILCEIDDEGGVKVAEAISKNKSMDSFLLGYNNITDVTAIKIA